LGRFHRPTNGNPVGIGIPWPAGQTGHHDNAFDAEQSGQLERLADDGIVIFAQLAGSQLVAGAVQSADFQAVIVDFLQELVALAFVFQQAVQIQVRRSAPVATGKFEHLEANFLRGGEKFVKAQSR
jgi:hypothetical protein